MPAPKQDLLMCRNQADNAIDLSPAEAAALLESNGIEPHLGAIRLALDVDVRRLVTIAGEEEEPVWTYAENSGHRSALSGKAGALPPRQQSASS
jgi:hypothetical protein